MPRYAWHVMNTYKAVNPDFAVDFVHEEDARRPVHPDVAECLRLVRDGSSKYHRIFDVPIFKGMFRNETVFNTALSDAVRFYLLDKYGGIYLDLDTWPVAPFDDWLLSQRYFHANVRNGDKTYPDVYFMGADGKTETTRGIYHESLLVKPTLLPVDDQAVNAKTRERLSRRLQLCDIKYGDFYCNADRTYVNHLNACKKNWWSEIKKHGPPANAGHARMRGGIFPA